MKKLALALVCLVSVAFFASCTQPVENPEPSIAVVTGDNYIYDGQTIDLGLEYNLGFRVASNSQTMKELAKFQLETRSLGLEEDSRPEVIDDTIVNLSGTEYVYQDVVGFVFAKAGIVGKIEFVAIVTDVDGKTNTKTVTVNLNQAEDPLEVKDFEWYRLGNTQTGLEEYGLVWDQNAKAPFARIKPIDNSVMLFKFNPEVWDQVNYPSDKNAAFYNGEASGATPIQEYAGVDVNQNGQYDDVIGTRMPDGTLHLIHVEMCRIGSYVPQGTPITIFGKSK